MHSSIKKEKICFLSLILSIEVGGYFTYSILTILRLLIYSKKRKKKSYLLHDYEYIAYHQNKM